MLENYKKKRNFEKTTEPPLIKQQNEEQKSVEKHVEQKYIEQISEQSIFVVQKHNARRIHYDFRLEHNGVLLSWAVPKGISDDPNDKRLAIRTEDHPVQYANFSGTIPKGEYGAGTVEIWDKGRFVNITVKNNKVQPLSEAIEKGHFIIFLKGEKLNGTYAFTKTDENWLIVKKKEEHKFMNQITIENKTIQITNAEKELDTGIKKSELVEYYKKIAPLMLPHIKRRLISMYRFPDGVNGKKFYQKNIPEYFPDWIGSKCIKNDSTCYTIVNDEAGIIYLANQVVEPHITVGKSGKDGNETDADQDKMINPDMINPDKMIFDLDPSKPDLKELKSIAIQLRDFLTAIGFHPYIMTSGSKGYHIAVPIKPELNDKELREFAFKISSALAKNNRTVTTELRKEKREGRIFIDVNRNSESQTSIAPYGARSRLKLPIASPFEWDELPNINPDSFTIRNFPKQDAWKDFEKNAVSIKEVMEKIKKI